MELRKGYKNTEVGIIPNDWEVDSIGNLAIIKTGGKNTQDRVENGEYPFFVRSQIVERINTYSYDGEAVLTAGDGVGVGKVVHYINGRFDFHQRVYRISDFSSSIDGYYFFEYFRNNFLNRIMQMTAKSSVDSVRMEMIANMLIPFPPTKAEQTAIATALSDMDNLIAGLEILIEKKKAIKQGAMQELLRPKEGWEEWRFGEIFSFYSTANYSKAEMTDAGEIGCMHYGLIHSISTANYSLSGGVRYYLNETKTNYEYIKDGDVIMVDASEDLEGVNKSVEVFGIGDQKFISGLHTYLLRDQNSVLANGFRGPLLNSKLIKDQFLSLAVGMKVYGVSKVQLKEVLVPVPPKEEQVAIANTLFEMDAEIEVIEGLLDKNRRLKQGMMQELLTGKTRLI